MPLHQNRRPATAALLLTGTVLGICVRASDEIPAVTERMQQYVEKAEAAGVVTLVAREGKRVHLSATGHADIESKRPMQTNTLFAIASMTKPITATAVMILQDEGKLSVSDPVSKHIPEFRDVRLKDAPPRREITIRDLMTHTSGVVGSQKNEGTLAETVRQIAARPLGFEPGARWQYGPGITVCGRVVEVVAGTPYEKFLAERIFAPLRMKDTTFFPNDAQQARIATLYRPGPKRKHPSLAPTDHWLSKLGPARTPNPSGGLFSTAADLRRFYQMILNGGQLDGARILSEEAVREMTRVHTPNLKTGFTPGNGWGLGWCVVREPQGVTAMLSPGSCGHGGAFGTQGWIDPKRKIIFVLMIQRTAFGNADASDIRRDFQQAAVDALVE